MNENAAELLHGMHVVRTGPPEAPPLLLVHGSGASGATWNPMVAALAERHRVILVDLPGCGQSPPAASYDVTAQAAEVAALLDGLGLDRIDAAGHSSGGYVLTALAEQRPDLLRSLALVSTGPSPEDFLPQPLILKVLLGPPFGPLLWSVRSDDLIRKGIRSTAALPIELPDELVAGVRATSYKAFRAIANRNLAYLAERHMPERLDALGLPVLVVFGGADPRWEPASAHRYDAVAAARVEILDGVGHLPMLEAPGATAELLLGFTAER